MAPTFPPYLYIIQPVADMREDKTMQSKVVSQALFSEKIAVGEHEGGWSCITTPDGYSGWVRSEAYIACLRPYETTCTVSRLAAHLYRLNAIEYGPAATLPYGSRLHVLDASDARWIKIAFPDTNEYYIQKGDVMLQQPRLAKGDLPAFSRIFLGLPYTWGGRSSFGYDCSGFVQMLYSHLGILLPRDARQQILDARFKTCGIDQAGPGDLLFFGKAEDRIMHVGMSLGGRQFIHATSRENQPWIRISSLCDFEWSGDPAACYPYRTGRQLI